MPRRPLPADTPWSDRSELRKSAKIAALALVRRYEEVRKLLVGVVLHSTVMRKRYLAALGHWASSWLRQRSDTSPLQAALANRPLLRSRIWPCRGATCISDRASGLPGNLTVGALVRCPGCRQADRCEAMQV